MSRSLYGLYDGLTHIVAEDVTRGIEWVISNQPYDPKYWQDYMSMRKRVCLKRDFGWRELSDLQNAFQKADIWTDFPAVGFTLVAAEFKGGDEDQRIDLLYMRNDGALLPCELKIGGDSRDAHGQLIRYISDLYFQRIDLEWVVGANKQFLGRIQDPVAKSIHADKFQRFTDENAIETRPIRILPRAGLLVDTEFPPQLLKAVRYLNGYCGFSIRLLQIAAFVEETWTRESKNFKFRLDFLEIQ